MATEIILPRVDMDMTSGTISRWFVAEGESVRKGQPLFEIETTKAAMEIEAPADGILAQVTAAEGVEVPVGQVVAMLLAEGEVLTAPAATLPASAAPDPVVQAAVIAPSVAPMTADNLSPVAESPAAPAAASGLAATPLAKRMARLSGVDLMQVRGSGPGGRIQAVDLAAPPAPGGQASLITLKKGQGKPVIFIHGFASDSTVWRGLVRGFEAENACLGLDLPGHGKAGAAVPASFEMLVDSVAETLLAAGLGAAHLVGHSLGGAVATALSLRHGFDIASLTLIAPAGLGPKINGDFLHGYASARSAASLAPWIRLLTGVPSPLEAAMVKAEMDLRDTPARAATLAQLAQTLFPDGTQAFSVRHGLMDPRQPTRVILGLADSIIPAAQAEGLGGLVGLHRLVGIGHLPQIEAQAVVRRLVEENIRSAG